LVAFTSVIKALIAAKIAAACVALKPDIDVAGTTSGVVVSTAAAVVDGRVLEAAVANVSV
jgi:hypothetical protein